jgi:hypothetical protein
MTADTRTFRVSYYSMPTPAQWRKSTESFNRQTHPAGIKDEVRHRMRSHRYWWVQIGLSEGGPEPRMSVAGGRKNQGKSAKIIVGVKWLCYCIGDSDRVWPGQRHA